MNSRPVRLLFCTLVLAMALAYSGCSHLPWVDGPSFHSDLKLKVAVLPFRDEAGIGGEPVEVNTGRLVAEELAKSNRLIVISTQDVQQYMAVNGVTQPITQNVASMMGRALGLNAVVLGSIAEASQQHKREGYRRWFKWFFDRKEYFAAVLVARVVDVESGIILGADIAEGAVDTSKLEKEAWKSGDTQTLEQSTIAASMDQAVVSVSENILNALSKTTWKGFLTEASGKEAAIRSGEEVGIRVGHRFVAYAVGEKITNAAGQTYIIPGPVKAKLVAREVGVNMTRLEVTEGQVFPGDSIEHAN